MSSDTAVAIGAPAASAPTDGPPGTPAGSAPPDTSASASPGTAWPHASVPRPEDPAGLGAARSLLLVRCAGATPPAAPPGVPVQEVSLAISAAGEVEPEGLRALERRLANEKVGTRIVICGPESAAYQARSVARAAGAIDEEICVVATPGWARRVFCAHCHQVAAYRTHIAGEVTCGGCGRCLVVYHHYSRQHAAYLGYQVDAEEPR